MLVFPERLGQSGSHSAGTLSSVRLLKARASMSGETGIMLIASDSTVAALSFINFRKWMQMQEFL